MNQIGFGVRARIAQRVAGPRSGRSTGSCPQVERPVQAPENSLGYLPWPCCCLFAAPILPSLEGCPRSMPLPGLFGLIGDGLLPPDLWSPPSAKPGPRSHRGGGRPTHAIETLIERNGSVDRRGTMLRGSGERLDAVRTPTPESVVSWKPMSWFLLGPSSRMIGGCWTTPPSSSGGRPRARSASSDGKPDGSQTRHGLVLPHEFGGQNNLSLHCRKRASPWGRQSKTSTHVSLVGPVSEAHVPFSWGRLRHRKISRVSRVIA